MKKMLVVAGVLALAAMGTSTAYAAPSFGGCQLDGNAKFANPLTANQPTPSAAQPNGVPWTNDVLTVDWGAAFKYTFTGDLTSCQSFNSSGPDATAPAAGKIYAGVPVSIGGTTYDWPFATPSGNGGCTGSATSGTSVVVWADNTVSVIDYSTSGALAAVGLTGNFRTGSFTFHSSATNTDKTFDLRYGHDYTGGPLAFEPPDPTACNGAGVTEAAIQGMLGEGYLQTN